MGARDGELRAEESREGLDRLAHDADVWHERRMRADARGQYRTQLRSLRDATAEMTSAVRSELDAIAATRPAGEVYERCRDLDRRAATVRRVWEFFRAKWDQRDETDSARVLSAADEVVWSCWAKPFRLSGDGVQPAPLPYVEPVFSARAFPRLRPPQEVRTADGTLRELVAKMPVPLTGIPPTCAPRPWWLIVLAHETGHHVAFDLIGECGVAALEEAMLAAAASDAEDGCPDPRWGSWTHELFADAFALASVGPSYLWALRELERGTEATMSAASDRYPPPTIRLAFGEAVLDALGLPVSAAPPEQEPARVDEDPAVGRLRSELQPVARLLADTPVGDRGLSLRTLCDWRPERFAGDGDVAAWSRQLLGNHPPAHEHRLESARLATAGAVEAWRQASEEADPELRAARRETLADRTLAAVAGSSEPATRGPADAPAPSRSLMRELAEDVLSLPMDEA